MPRERSEVLSGAFTAREAKIINRLAKAQGCTVSGYVRGAVMASAVMDGDIEAMQVVGQFVVQHFAEKSARLMRGDKLSPATA